MKRLLDLFMEILTTLSPRETMIIFIKDKT